MRKRGGKPLAESDHVESFVEDGTAPANHPAVFKRLRWEDR